MRYVRKVVMTAFVWATASSMLFASTPYYVCRCLDGTVKLHVAAASPSSSCCSSGCCAVEAKEKPCCQAAKKKLLSKSGCGNQKATHQNTDGSPSFSEGQCQKTLVQPEDRSFCRLEIKTTDLGDSIFDVSTCLFDTTPAIEVDTATIHWRIDKSRPPTDLVVAFQRLTI